MGAQREHEGQSHQANWLFTIARLLSSNVEMEILLETVTKAMADLTGCESGSVFLYDDEVHALRFVASADSIHLIAQEIPIPLRSSIAGLAFSENRTVIIKDTTKFARYYKKIDQETNFVTHSVLAVPITYREQVLGVLEVVNKKGGLDYNAEDTNLLETLASLLALSFENASLEGIIGKIKDEAARLDKMKTDFIAITSHELRTPLGLIIGHSTFLREIVDSDIQDQMDTIIRNAMRLKELIENMTSVDNAQAGTAVMRAHNVSLKKIIQDSIESIGVEAKHKKLKVQVDLDQSAMMIEGDEEKIGIAILNVLRNAVMFTDEGGDIIVKAQEKDNKVQLSVIDSGIGIPEKDVPHIFERFYQVESHLTRKHGGMGLGLSVAKMMVEMHGGNIIAKSIPGKGSKFTITLPIDSSKAEATSKVFIT
jgi:signal transduction histidine kinase